MMALLLGTAFTRGSSRLHNMTAVMPVSVSSRRTITFLGDVIGSRIATALEAIRDALLHCFTGVLNFDSHWFSPLD
jgi:hypothetical protein